MLQYYTHLAHIQPASAVARHDFLLEKQTRKNKNDMQINWQSMQKTQNNVTNLIMPNHDNLVFINNMD